MCRLVSIVYRPKNAQPSSEAYTRVPLDETNLVVGYGIEGDAKGGGKDRNLNIMSAATMGQLACEGFTIEPGRMGEQLILEGVDVNTLADGSRLQIGDTVCVVLTIPRTGCSKLERFQGKAREDAADRLGMMARVEVGGRITVGDKVTIVSGTPR